MLRPVRAQSDGRFKLDPVAIRQRIEIKKSLIEREKKIREYRLFELRQRTNRGVIPKLDVSAWCDRPTAIIPEDCCVLAATDELMFIGFQLMLKSLQLTNEVDVILVDLGLNQKQRKWAKRHEVTLVSVNKIPNPVKANGWQTFNKPNYFSLVPSNYRRVLWIDSDCVVRGSLREAFDVIDKRPFLTADSVATSRCSVNDAAEDLKNHDRLYKYLPVESRWTNPPFLNAGVVGFDLSRDEEILRYWRACVSLVHKKRGHRRNLRLYDQGALVWALEKKGEWMVTDDLKWNDSTVVKGQLTPSKFITKTATSNSIILHFAGLKKKPWSGWNTSYVEFHQTKKYLSPIMSNDVSLYMFSWESGIEGTISLKRFADKGYPYLGKERMFFQPIHALASTSYIGVFNPLWAERNKDKVPILGTQKPPKDTVLCDSLVEKGWTSYTPEFEQMFDDLGDKFGFRDDDTINSSAVICHIDVFRDWARTWRKMFTYLQEKHGNRMMPEEYYRHDLLLRLPGVLSMLYFTKPNIKKAKLEV